MKIGLIGAPGSGKTHLGRRLAAELDLDLIDGYVEELSDRTDYVYGRYATYIGNIHIGIARHHIEKTAESFVTCGTMLDTVTYLAIQATDADDGGDMRRLTGGLVVLGCMVEDMMDYDHLFYLPSDASDDYTSSLAQGLEEALTVFGIDFAVLDQATLDDRVAKVLAHINWITGSVDEAAASD